MFRTLCWTLLAFASVASAQIQSTPAQAIRPQTFDPQSPTDWFRRADDLTNIRLPGSAPFHMKVTFHAFPGIDFSKPGKSTILTGDGIYEETWLSPEKWRREVTLGTYHAVEVRADGVRKFQATSDYEPSRVLMLLRALLYPMPRFLLEPEIQEEHIHWKMEHLVAGTLPYVRISFTADLGGFGPDPRSYEFLPDGTLVRSEDYNGVMASWQNDARFAGKLVPRHFEVQGAGLDGNMVTADISLEAIGATDPGITQLSGEPAEPGMTLRPFDQFDVHLAASPIHFEIPQGQASMDHATDYPVGVKVYTIAVVDRYGITREAEMSGMRVFGQPVRPSQMEGIRIGAQHMVESLWKDRYHPATIDGKPCQYLMFLHLYKSGTVDSGN
jgi:hypothetical protein